VAGVELMALGWLWWRAWDPLVARDAAALCMARVAWQAWRLATSTFVSRGRRGTGRHPPSFRVAGMALDDIHLGWLWWRAWGLLVARDSAALCVAGVALGKAWHL